MIAKTPPDRPHEPGMRGSYGQGDFVESAQRSRLHKDQHYGRKPPGAPEVPDPYGEGGYAASGDTADGSRQSGYGVDYGQRETAQRDETRAAERDFRRAEKDGNAR